MQTLRSRIPYPLQRDCGEIYKGPGYQGQDRQPSTLGLNQGRSLLLK